MHPSAFLLPLLLLFEGLCFENLEGKASNYAQDFINRIAEATDSVKLDSCKFCHIEEAKADISERFEKDGYCFVPIENCSNNTKDMNHGDKYENVI